MDNHDEKESTSKKPEKIKGTPSTLEATFNEIIKIDRGVRRTFPRYGQFINGVSRFFSKPRESSPSFEYEVPLSDSPSPSLRDSSISSRPESHPRHAVDDVDPRIDDSMSYPSNLGPRADEHYSVTAAVDTHPQINYSNSYPSNLWKENISTIKHSAETARQDASSALEKLKKFAGKKRSTINDEYTYECKADESHGYTSFKSDFMTLPTAQLTRIKSNEAVQAYQDNDIEKLEKVGNDVAGAIQALPLRTEKLKDKDNKHQPFYNKISLLREHLQDILTCTNTLKMELKEPAIKASSSTKFGPM